jgi:hypothetical protein
MSFTITLGWWTLPVILMLVGSVWTFYPRPSEKRSSDYDFSFWIPQATRLVATVILTLVSWLVWALLR